VTRLTLNRSATSSRRCPSSLSFCVSTIWCGGSFGLRPNFIPRRCASFTPARVRSLSAIRDYKRLEAGLDRLKGTSIKTNITAGGVRVKHGFGLIDDWKIIEKSPTNERMIAVEVTLSEWLYNAVAAREVLTLNRDYFRLGGALERRLYEVARKHCGRQAKWIVGVEVLHRKSGSASPLKRFRLEAKRIALSDVIPDYRMRYEAESDQMTFHTRDAKAMAEMGTIDI
jgi:plasmid replication initiation protein